MPYRITAPRKLILPGAAEFRTEQVPDMSIPNQILSGDGFYVSYNDRDISIYGGVTTALVKGQMERFYILNGDHRQAFTPLITQGFNACLGYYREHLGESNKRSDKLPTDIPIKPKIMETKKLTFPPRRTEQVTYINYKEMAALVAAFLGEDPKNYNLVAAMNSKCCHPAWSNDSIVTLSIDPENPKLQAIRADHLAEVRKNKRISWPWELDAVANEISRTTDQLPKGEYIIEICW